MAPRHHGIREYREIEAGAPGLRPPGQPIAVSMLLPLWLEGVEMADLDDILDAHEREMKQAHEKTRKAMGLFLTQQQLISVPLREIIEKLNARGHKSREETLPLGGGVAIIMQPKGSTREYRFEFAMDKTEDRFTAWALPSMPSTDYETGPAGERGTVALKDLSVDFVRDTTTEWIADVLMADSYWVNEQ